MLYFLNLDGTMTLAEPQRVFQGSNNVNTVYVLSAIAPPTALEISFTLPSGLTTAYYPMIYNGTTDEYTVPNTTTTVYLRSFLLTSNITAEVGTVGVSVNAVYSNADGTTGNQTSFTGSFNVEYSSIPETVTTGTADELQQALDLLSQYYTQQQAIITGGTNGEYLQSQGNNQLPVWTSFDMDFVTANRAQSFSNAQKAQARTNIGAITTTDLSKWLQTDISDITDLNALADKEKGSVIAATYGSNQTENKPSTWGSIISFRASDGNFFQLAAEVTPNNVSDRWWVRQANNFGKYGTWRELAVGKLDKGDNFSYSLTNGFRLQVITDTSIVSVAAGQVTSKNYTYPIAYSSVSQVVGITTNQSGITTSIAGDNSTASKNIYFRNNTTIDITINRVNILVIGY